MVLVCLAPFPFLSTGDLNRHRYSLLAFSLVLVLLVFLAMCKDFPWESKVPCEYDQSLVSWLLQCIQMSTCLSARPVPLRQHFAAQSKVDSVGLANVLLGRQRRSKPPALGRINVSVCPHTQLDLED